MTSPTLSNPGGKGHVGTSGQLWWTLAAVSVPVVVAGTLWVIRVSEQYVPYEVGMKGSGDGPK